LPVRIGLRPAQERLRPRHAAPGVDAGEDELLVGIELAAHGRVDPVAGDHHVGDRVRPVAESDGHLALGFGGADALMAEMDAGRAEPLAYGAVERHVQLGAVDADFGQRIAREAAALLLVEKLAEAVVEAALLVLDALGDECLVEAERGELAHRMGQEGDADAELLQLRRGFVDAAWQPPLVQVEGEGEPADAGADDRDVHGPKV
jgi:hypothetical protein